MEASLHSLPGSQPPARRQPEAAAESIALTHDQVRNPLAQASEELQTLRRRPVSPVPVWQERRGVVAQVLAQRPPAHHVTISSRIVDGGRTGPDSQVAPQREQSEGIEEVT